MNKTRILGLAIAVSAITSSAALAAGGTSERVPGTLHQRAPPPSLSTAILALWSRSTRG